MKKTRGRKISNRRKSAVLVCALLFIFSTILLAQYRRGSYDKTLLLTVEYDKDVLPRGRSYKILRSVDKETHIAAYDMDTFTFYIDKDNTTEDDIDAVYSYDPNDKNSLKRVENPFKPGEFQTFKEAIMKTGMGKSSAFYSYPGIDDFISYAEKYKYAVVKRDNGFMVQFKNPDTNQVKSMMGIDSKNTNLVLQNNYDYTAGTWLDSGIVFPVYAKNSQDPTVKRMVSDTTGKLSELIKGRK